MDTGDKMWLIWSIEHNAWWRAARYGYTGKKELAGRYSFEEACEIVMEANQFTKNMPMEAMVKDERVKC